MILISISFSLLALVAGMYLLDKTKKEGLGKFYSFISWLVVVVSILTLLCSLTRGVWRMSYRQDMEHSMEMCRPGMMGGGDCCMPMRGQHCGMMSEDCCKEMEGKGNMSGHCSEMEEADENEMEKEGDKEIIIEKDTVKK